MLSAQHNHTLISVATCLKVLDTYRFTHSFYIGDSFSWNSLSQNSTEANYKFATIEHLERRLSLAHRRYLESVTALARVRKLAINVQINVGQNQVIAG
jgi:hypothetical protein